MSFHSPSIVLFNIAGLRSRVLIDRLVVDNIAKQPFCFLEVFLGVLDDDCSTFVG